jgi:hypothetical protein
MKIFKVCTLCFSDVITAKMPGQCYFQSKWETDDEVLQDWVVPVAADRTAAKCKYCSKIIHLGSMGRTALTSHSREKSTKLQLPDELGLRLDVWTDMGVL